MLLHGGAQNAHTWDTVAMALDWPLLALDLPGHGHSDGPGVRPEGQLSAFGNAEDVAAAIRVLAPGAGAVVGMSMGGITTIALTKVAPGLVARVVLVDITPGVTGRKAKQITDFVNGPEELPELRGDPGPHHRLQPDPHGGLAAPGSCTTPSSRRTGGWVWRYARWRVGR